MLASFEPADGVLRVHTVRQDDIDDIDFRVVFEGVVVFVVVNIFRIYSVAQRDFVGLVWVPADESDNFGFFTLLDSGKNIPNGELPQSNNGIANFFPRRIRNSY